MSSHPGRVLVVDDNENNRKILARWLTRNGYSVSVADSARALLERIRDEAVDLVLLDIEMPDIIRTRRAGGDPTDLLGRPPSRDHGHGAQRERGHRQGPGTGGQRLPDQADRLSGGAGARAHAPVPHARRAGAAGERGTLRPGRAWRQRWTLGLEPARQRDLPVVSVEVDARLSRQRDWRPPRRMVRPHPRGRSRESEAQRRRTLRREDAAFRGRGADAAQGRGVPLDAHPRPDGVRRRRARRCAWPARRPTSPKAKSPIQ